MTSIGTYSQEPIYTIKAVSKRTGIKTVTLRAWERRYGLPSPRRSEGGHRLYSEREIETIKWLVARQEEGLSISRAVDLWQQLLAQGFKAVNLSGGMIAWEQAGLPVKKGAAK